MFCNRKFWAFYTYIERAQIKQCGALDLLQAPSRMISFMAAKRRIFILPLLLSLLFGSHSIPSASAITLGCSKAQRDARIFASNFERNKNLEANLFSKGSYQQAYKAYYEAQANFQKLYDAVLKSPKCFSVSQRNAFTKNYNRFYKQVGACDLYGYTICSRWIKPQNSDPCAIYKLARDYQDCIEDHARPDYEYEP